MAEEQLRQEVGKPTRVERLSYEPDQDVSVADQDTPKKLSLVHAFFMIVVAMVLDMLSFIPFINTVVVVFADILFIFWFFMVGIRFNNKKIISLGTTTIIEAIPFLGWIPMITLNVVYSLYYSD